MIFSEEAIIQCVCVCVVGVYVGMSVHVRITGNNMFFWLHYRKVKDSPSDEDKCPLKIFIDSFCD